MPGKFEGEQNYVPYFWVIAMHGLADEDDGETFRFFIEKHDRDMFPSLKGVYSLRLIEDENGFVYATREHRSR